MKRHALILMALFLGACGGGQGDDDDDASAVDAGGGEGGTPQADASSGPATTTLRVHYPASAGAIAIRGGAAPLSWTVSSAAVAGAGDTWTFTTTALTSATEWKAYLADSEWSQGANYHVAPGQTVDIYPHFHTARGQVMRLFAAFPSTVLGNSRAVYAYLPPSYAENTTARFPVVYMQDGQNLFDAARAFGAEWQVDETMDAAASGGRCTTDQRVCQSDGDCGGARCDSFREAIIIGSDNAGAGRIYEYTPTSVAAYNPSGGADKYLQMLTSELRPMVNTMLRTLPERADTAILGSSLGGLLSIHAGIVSPATFGLIGIMSPSTWWDGRIMLTRVPTTAAAPARPLKIYVDSGDAGDSNDGVTDTRDLAAAYRTLGYVQDRDLDYLVAPGHQHSEPYWAQRLPGALTFLLGARER